MDAPPAVTSAAPQPTAAVRAFTLASWVMESFGPLLAFWIALRVGGLVPAIGVSIATGVVLVIRSVVRERKVSPFTAFIAASVAIFGALDLHYRTGFFLKLEPALGNAATGIFFLATVLWGRPIIIEFAEKAAGKALPRARRYLTGWTVAWSVYFFVRAAVYVWMAFNVSLERAVLVRGALGPLSFAAMFVLEQGVRRVVFRAPAAQTAITDAGRLS